MSNTIYHFEKKILSDAHTPVSVYLKMRDLYPSCILLESSDYYGNEKNYSYICFQPLCGISVQNGEIDYLNEELPYSEKQTTPNAEVLEEVNQYLTSFHFIKAQRPATQGRFFGHFNYDAVQYFDSMTLTAADDKIDIPDIRLYAYKFVIVFDHYHHAIYLTQHNFSEGAENELIHIESSLRINYFNNFRFKVSGEERTSCNDQEYMDIVNLGIDHCRRGDTFQIVLSRAFEIDFKGDDFNVYRALRMVNPSPYLFYFDYGDYRLFGSSPEAQIKVNEGRAIIHPIAGTASRTGVPEEDNAALIALKNDAKENAEHVMLVDLARNDLSKSFKEVSVSYYKNIQEFSHVIHMVSEVVGEKMTHDNSLKVLAETFPAGTLSGAPKYKAIQLIDKLEHSDRSFYGGCVGYIQPQGETNQAIMIRSFLSKGHTLHYRAGAGITVNSIPLNELNEVSHKLRGLRTAIQLAQETSTN